MGNGDYCVVVGAVNVDIGGKPDAALIQKDSNPGRIFTSLGGVGRNIAHNMRLMGMQVKLITAIGDDDSGRRIIDSCEKLGIDISGFYESSTDATSSYMFIADQNGDMSVAVSDMNIYKNITPDYLETRLEEINNAKIVVIDTNIPTESIAYLVRKCKVPIMCDPVSCTKAARLIPSLDRLFAVTPNELETRILTGVKIESEDSLADAAKAFHDAGVKNVFITLGENGVFVSGDNESFHLKNLPCKLVNATGAGDAMMAGFAYGYAHNYGLKEIGYLGLAAAAISLEANGTINEEMTIDMVLSRAGLQ